MIVCLAYHIMFTSFFFAKKYIKRTDCSAQINLAGSQKRTG